METKFDFNVILLTGGISSPIETRSSIRIYTEEGYLPIIVAPMDTVISEKNYKKFKSKLFQIAMPRGSEYEVGHNFHSIGLEEAKDIAYNRVKCNHSHLLIDIANGHMQYLVNLVKMIKHHYPLVQLMVGNIANPKMYTVLSDAGSNAQVSQTFWVPRFSERPVFWRWRFAGVAVVCAFGSVAACVCWAAPVSGGPVVGKIPWFAWVDASPVSVACL